MLQSLVCRPSQESDETTDFKRELFQTYFCVLCSYVLCESSFQIAPNLPKYLPLPVVNYTGVGLSQAVGRLPLMVMTDRLDIFRRIHQSHIHDGGGLRGGREPASAPRKPGNKPEELADELRNRSEQNHQIAKVRAIVGCEALLDKF